MAHRGSDSNSVLSLHPAPNRNSSLTTGLPTSLHRRAALRHSSTAPRQTGLARSQLRHPAEVLTLMPILAVWNQVQIFVVDVDRYR